MRLPFLFLLLAFSASLSGQTRSVTGVVLDAETMQPLPSATIRVVGTSKGTVTNSQGRFIFSLPYGTATLSARYLGYEPDTVTISNTGTGEYTFRLRPSVIQIAGVTVTDEDPAYDIIRRAIESKKKWMHQLKTFRANAFNRTQIRTDSSIAAIIEAYSILLWNREDSLREVVVQKRQTGNLPASGGVSRVGEMMNFNDDKIRQGGYVFLGPTAPEAFDVYDYQLLRTRSLDSYDIYDIRVIPRSSIVPLFRGTISIASRSYAVMNVDLQANEAFTMPFVTIRRVAYKQSFNLFEEKFWLPVNFRSDAQLSISIMGITLPAIGVEKDVVVYDYTINAELPDSVNRMKKLTVDSSASKFDSTFWAEHDVLPLTVEQDSAYRELDSTQTLEKKFAPSGATMTVLSALGPLDHAELWFNRVEGFHVGAHTSVDSLILNDLSLRGGIGYGFADKKIKFTSGFSVHFGEKQSKRSSNDFAVVTVSDKRFTLASDFYDKHIILPQSVFAGLFFNSFYALIGKNDFFDYYQAKGITTSLAYIPVTSVKLKAEVLAEVHQSLYQNTSFSWFAQDKQYRPQPQIVEGRLNALRLSASYNPFGFIAFAKDAFTVHGSIEHAGSLFSENFHFTQASLRLQGKITTMLREELPMPPALFVYLSAGLSDGAIPPQRYFTPDNEVTGLIMPGSLRGTRIREFYGDDFVTLTIEHNFRRMLFASLPGQWLNESKIDFIVGGSISRYMLSGNVLRTPTFPAAGMNGWYYEANIGFQNIFDLFRIDITRRFTQPKDILFTVSVSDFFSGFLTEQ